MADRDAPEAGLLIDGARVPAASGARGPVRNPATGAVLAHVAQAGIEDAYAATMAERARVLLRLAELIRANAEDRLRLEASNVGKSLGESRGEIASARRPSSPMSRRI